MVKHLHDSHLAKQLLSTGGRELSLVNNLNSHLLARDHVAGQLHLGEIAFPNGTDELVFADLRLVTSADGRDLRWDIGGGGAASGTGGEGVAGSAASGGARLT